jgi:hypothetical protein
MCTYITHKTEIAGSGKGAEGWFQLQGANVYFDHPYHAPLDHALIIDFVNPVKGAGARVAVEMDAESARGLIKAIEAALQSGLEAHLPEAQPVASA